MDNGAKLAWLIDPIVGNVTIYRPGQDAEIILKPEVVRGSGPVEGFELKCARLWSAL
jgi:Uma2 family endonuclease